MKTKVSAQAKNLLAIIILSALTSFIAPAWAAAQTVTLSVPGMYCAVCPITVKKALKKVKGVGQVKDSFENREATVNFDDAKTNVDALIKATADAGYPSTVKRTQP
jgi:mercuric ion binding protein